MKLIIGIFVLLVITIGFSLSNAFGEVRPNSALILEGSGYAVTEEIIEISDIDLAISTQKQTGSTIKSTIEDGFITLNDSDFLAAGLQASFLRDGKYIRISGNIESDSGEVSIRFFGRLVEESKSASVYGFTGSITNNGNSYKVIYTAKLSELTNISPDITPTKTTNNQLTIYILKGSSNQGIGTYTDVNSLKYFSQDRITIEPGTTITIVNDDVVSHSIKSGKDYGDRYNRYIADNRISTGEILPGKSITITFNDAGFYRLYDPDYQWMGIVSYVFPNINNQNLGTQANPKN
jgi:plastocyanin